MTTDIMIDLETLGTTADAIILSIGAVRFDISAGAGSVFAPERDRYLVNVEIDSQRDRAISADTLRWWLDQSRTAQRAFHGPSIAIEMALIGLGAFVQATPGKPNVWSNGADFDLPMLAHAYRQHKIALPWAPYSGRCYRTYKNLPGARSITVPRMGIAHSALDDAIYQAQHLCAIHAALFGHQEGQP